MLPIKKILDITPTVNGNQTRIGEQTVLKEKKVKAILASTWTASGSMTAAQLQECRITLRDKTNTVVIDNAPLYLFDPKQNANGNLQPVQFEAEIDWNQSFITVPSFGTTAGQRIPLWAIYE